MTTRPNEKVMFEAIRVSCNVQSIYYCSAGINGFHGKDCLISNNGIEYLVLYG